MRPILLAAGLVAIAVGSPALAQNLAGASNLSALGVTTTGDRPAGTSPGQASTAGYVYYSRKDGPFARAITGNNAPVQAQRDVQPGPVSPVTGLGKDHAAAGVQPTTTEGTNFWVDAKVKSTQVFQRGNISPNGVSLPNSGVAVPH